MLFLLVAFLIAFRLLFYPSITSGMWVLDKARQEERILLTVDLDFAQLLAISGESLPSVILFRLGNVSREVVNRHLLAILNDYATELTNGVIISVSDVSIRLRYLPI